jgi:hypothetical protein
MRGQAGWRRCSKCANLGFSLDTQIGGCPGGGSHDYSNSSEYVVANLNDDLSYLVRGRDSFEDATRNVQITVDTINSKEGCGF